MARRRRVKHKSLRLPVLVLIHNSNPTPSLCRPFVVRRFPMQAVLNALRGGTVEPSKAASVDDMPSAGFTPAPGHEACTFGGGCFWRAAGWFNCIPLLTRGRRSVQLVFDRQPGVVKTLVGYSQGVRRESEVERRACAVGFQAVENERGALPLDAPPPPPLLTACASSSPFFSAGHTSHPTYKQVCTGATGHSEVRGWVRWARAASPPAGRRGRPPFRSASPGASGL